MDQVQKDQQTQPQQAAVSTGRPEIGSVSIPENGAVNEYLRPSPGLEPPKLSEEEKAVGIEYKTINPTVPSDGLAKPSIPVGPVYGDLPTDPVKIQQDLKADPYTSTPWRALIAKIKGAFSTKPLEQKPAH